MTGLRSGSGRFRCSFTRGLAIYPPLLYPGDEWIASLLVLGRGEAALLFFFPSFVKKLSRRQQRLVLCLPAQEWRMLVAVSLLRWPHCTLSHRPRLHRLLLGFTCSFVLSSLLSSFGAVGS